MKTRVAIILPYFSSGGAQVMISRLASHLDLEQVEPEVICIYGEPLNNPMERSILEHGVPIRFIGKGKGFSAGAILALNAELNRFQPDVIHTHLSACVYCAPWVMLHRTKMLHTVHNMPQHELIRPKRAVMKMLYSMRCAVPVAISHEIQRMMKSHYGLKQDVELVYNPVDVQKFSSISRKEHDGFVFVSVGRLSRQKNQQLLVDAFAQVQEKHPDTQLWLLGDGPNRDALKAQVSEKGLEDCVHLHGNADHVEAYLAASDAFVLSSIYEGLPLVVLEAMAASLPVISTDVGGVRDIVSDNGILVESENLSQLVLAMCRLIEEDETRRKMSEKSRAYVDQYDSAKIADQYLDLYKKYARKR